MRDPVEVFIKEAKDRRINKRGKLKKWQNEILSMRKEGLYLKEIKQYIEEQKGISVNIASISRFLKKYSGDTVVKTETKKEQPRKTHILGAEENDSEDEENNRSGTISREEMLKKPIFQGFGLE